MLLMFVVDHNADCFLLPVLSMLIILFLVVDNCYLLQFIISSESEALGRKSSSGEIWLNISFVCLL